MLVSGLNTYLSEVQADSLFPQDEEQGDGSQKCQNERPIWDGKTQ